MPTTTSQALSAITEAEKKLQSILIDLVNEHDIKLQDVRIDVRTFANFKVDIFISPFAADRQF